MCWSTRQIPRGCCEAWSRRQPTTRSSSSRCPTSRTSRAAFLLLTGSFPRHDRGIFDRTHLHFYTPATALELVRSDSGLTVTRVSTTPVPLEDVWPSALGSGARELAMRSQMLAGRLAPTLFAFQWLIVARRSPD